MPIPKLIARFNRYVTNPIARLVAGWLAPFAIVIHRGRVSNRERRTPVWAFATDDNGLVIALTYGADSDWVRNVLRTGGCTVKRSAKLLSLAKPRILIGPEGMSLVPAMVRGPLRLLGVTEFLRLTPLATQTP